MEKEELRELAREAVHARIREGVKAVIEQVLEEEMREHLGAGHRERTPLRRGWRNGHYTRELITPVGKLEQLRVPRDREGELVTEVFERYKRMTGDVEEAVLEMYLQGVSVRRVAEITRALSRVKVGKDAVSRIARRLQEELALWRGRRLERAYPYLFLDATYLKVQCGERVREVALLVAVGVDEEGHREVLAVEEAGGERREVYRQLLRGLLDRGLRGVLLVVSDDHEAIKQGVASELAGGEMAALPGPLPAQRAGPCAHKRGWGGGSRLLGHLRGTPGRDGTGPGPGFPGALRAALPQGGGDPYAGPGRRPHLPALPRPSPPPHQDHQPAGAALPRAEAAHPGGRRLPQPGERPGPGHGRHPAGQRGLGPQEVYGHDTS
ncbi:MAG: IS256 family transposase [Dehalococcoidia bacterium]|nr:IS256 family transposase [Dehalococcoidia bacterium]